MNFWYYRQFPVLIPEHYMLSDLDFIVPRVLELTYAAYGLKDWARCLRGMRSVVLRFGRDWMLTMLGCMG